MSSSLVELRRVLTSRSGSGSSPRTFGGPALLAVPAGQVVIDLGHVRDPAESAPQLSVVYVRRLSAQGLAR